MRKFIIRAFLQGICAIALCLLIYGRAESAELTIDKTFNVDGVGCLSADDTEKLLPIVIAQDGKRLPIVIEAAKQKINCILFAGWVVYKGVARTIHVGTKDWEVLHFQNTEGADLYSYRPAQGEAA